MDKYDRTEMKERCRQGVKVRGSDKAAHTSQLRFGDKVKGDGKQEHANVNV